jgi:hypothetical protein
MNNTPQLEKPRRSKVPVAITAAVIGAIGVVVGSTLPEILRDYFPPRQKQTLPSPEQIPSPPPNTQSAGSTRLPGGILMCWGQVELTKGSGTNWREFEFKFPEGFAAAPTVTTGIDAKGSGYAFAIYNYKLTEDIYTGQIAEIMARNNSVPVMMHYLAIGRVK